MTRGTGFDSGLAATISEIGYVLLLNRDMAEISLKRRKSYKKKQQLTTNLQVSYSFKVMVYNV